MQPRAWRSFLSFPWISATASTSTLYWEENTDNELWSLVLLQAKILDIFCTGFLKSFDIYRFDMWRRSWESKSSCTFNLVENTNAFSSNFKVFHPYLCHFETAFMNLFSHNFCILMHQCHLNVNQKSFSSVQFMKFENWWYFRIKGADTLKSGRGLKVKSWDADILKRDGGWTQCAIKHSSTIAIQIFSVQ